LGLDGKREKPGAVAQTRTIIGDRVELSQIMATVAVPAKREAIRSRISSPGV
jgi:hypothetical protein